MSKDAEAKTKIIFETCIPKGERLPFVIYFNHLVDKIEVDRVVSEYPGVYISEMQRTGECQKFVFLVPHVLYEKVWSEVPERLGAVLWGI